MLFKKSKNDKNTYCIIGLGRFGTALARELAQSGADLVVIDRDEAKIREFREYTENAFIVPVLDKPSLAEVGVQNCDIAVICIAEHIDTSILTTLNVVGLGVPHVVSKAQSAEHGEILEKLGAEVVYPERDIAVRLAHRLEASRVLDYVQLSEKLNISKILVPEDVIGKNIKDANFRGRFGVNIIAIENKGKLTDNIRPDYTFKEGDILFVSGSRESLSKI